MGRRIAFAGILVWALLLSSAVIRGHVLAQEGGRAGLVVRFADGRVESRCVAFDGAQVSGQALLQRSGLASTVKTEGQGGLVCAIEGTGCGADDCLCQCQGGSCVYWSYWRLSDDGWTYSPAGASQRLLSDGDVDGWSWGPGSVTSAIEPPAMRFEDICNEQAVVYDGSATETAGQTTAWWPYLIVALLVLAIGAGAVAAGRRRNQA